LNGLSPAIAPEKKACVVLFGSPDSFVITVSDLTLQQKFRWLRILLAINEKFKKGQSYTFPGHQVA